jgi:hypothetical protein
MGTLRTTVRDGNWGWTVRELAEVDRAKTSSCSDYLDNAPERRRAVIAVFKRAVERGTRCYERGFNRHFVRPYAAHLNGAAGVQIEGAIG